MRKKNIAVIFGGNSTEYEVSLQSSFSVIGNLDKQKYHIILIGITREGDWYHYFGETEKMGKAVDSVPGPDYNNDGALNEVL